MKRLVSFLLSMVMVVLCCPALSEHVGELPAFVAPAGVAMTENPAWERTLDGYSTRGWLLKGDVHAASQAVETYACSLEDWGFVMTAKVEPAGLNACYWFFDVDETGYTEAVLNGYTFETFVYGEVSKDQTQVALMIGYVPGVEFHVEEQWDSLFGEAESVWESAFDQEESAVEALPGYRIPSFEHYAGDVITSLGKSGHAQVYSMAIQNMSAANEYLQLLESYGIGGEDASEPQYGFPYYYWLEDCEEEIEPLVIDTENGPMKGYFFIAIEPEGDALNVSVQYAQGLSPVDTGERWSGEALSKDDVDDVKAFLAEYEAADQIYTFSNPDVAEEIAGALKKEIGEITRADVENLAYADVLFDPASPDLSDFANMPGTIAFGIRYSGSEVVDVSPLVNCRQMKRLVLLKGDYSNLDKLAGLKNLELVSLTDTSISDISWLADMKNLKEVYIENCKITDFSALATLPKLEKVYLKIPLSADVSFLYGKGIKYGKTGYAESTFDSFYELNWGKPGEEKNEVPEAKETKKPSSDKPSSDSSRERCLTCGGDGKVDSSCANCSGDGKRDCMSCAGKGYDNCSGCYGSGDRRCGSCNGTGKSGSRSCTTCSGRGERNCSSCSGSGRKRCSACSGSGDRSCTYCGGDGKNDRSCSSCSGSGWR